MIKIVFSKVMWVGRATVFTVGLAVTLALMLGIATVALAAVPGDPFKLGRINTINTISTLVGSASSPMLRIDNNGSGVALDLQVEPGKAPMKVNSGTKVANLNSDTVDGYDSFDFYQFGEKVNDSAHADYADSAGEAQTAQMATDSEQLDGKNSTDFLSSSIYRRQAGRTGTVGTVNYLIARCDPGDLPLSAGYWTTEDETTDTIYVFSRGDDAAGGSQGSWDFRWRDRAPATYYNLTVYCADITTP